MARGQVAIALKRWQKRLVLTFLAAVIGGLLGPAAGIGLAAGVETEQEAVEDGQDYDAYLPAALKEGQYYYYTCEFDAAWVIVKTFGHDVPFEEQLEIVGHDRSVEP